MRWSWRIGRLAGIDVYVHATFPLLLAWIALSAYQRQQSTAAVVGAIAFILAIFGIVVLHELGHALTARRYGIATRDITLLPIGGVARLERMPREPRQELLVALAGPAVNVALAAVLYLVLIAIRGAGASTADALTLNDSVSGGSLLARLIAVNVWLALFNLIPAFPMDGGRVLRALLAMRSRNYARATETAARVGRFFALLFGLIGLFVVGNPFLVFIALFVWLGAAAEAAAVQTSAMLDGVPLSQVMITDVRTLAPDEPLRRAMELTLSGFQQDFPVVEHGAVVGLLTRQQLVRGLAERGADAPVDTVMGREFQMAGPDDPVEEALTRLKSCACHAMPVVRGRELLGVLTTENVGEFIMLRAALRGAAAAEMPA
ncbi:MAG: Peptidase [Geminicoccaceae bacterium]|jgi:Zn-dependent protease/predicted transcriptional regulator|nr:Peptidase [Geminicoccaceae bacterium]